MEINEFLDKYGYNTTTNFDLRDISRDLNLKGCKVVMRNELPEYSKSLNVICNLQTSNEPGSHWVLCSREFNIYFDSYGIVPILEVANYFSSEYKYNTIQVQPNNTEICGQLCLYVLYKLYNKSKFEDIVVNINSNSKDMT